MSTSWFHVILKLLIVQGSIHLSLGYMIVDHSNEKRLVPVDKSTGKFKVFIANRWIDITIPAENKIELADLTESNVINTDPEAMILLHKHSLYLIRNGTTFERFTSPSIDGLLVWLPGNNLLYMQKGHWVDHIRDEFLYVAYFRIDFTELNLELKSTIQMPAKKIGYWNVMPKFAFLYQGFAFIMGHRMYTIDNTEDNFAQESFIARICARDSNLDSYTDVYYNQIALVDASFTVDRFKPREHRLFMFMNHHADLLTTNATFSFLKENVSRINSFIEKNGQTCAQGLANMKLLTGHLNIQETDVCKKGDPYKNCSSNTNRMPVGHIQRPQKVFENVKFFHQTICVSLGYPLYGSFCILVGDMGLGMIHFQYSGISSTPVVESMDLTKYFKRATLKADRGELIFYPIDPNGALLQIAVFTCSLFKDCWQCEMFGPKLDCAWINNHCTRAQVDQKLYGIPNICFQIVDYQPKEINSSLSTPILITFKGYTKNKWDRVEILVGTTGCTQVSMIENKITGTFGTLIETGEYKITVAFIYTGYKYSVDYISADTQEMVKVAGFTNPRRSPLAVYIVIFIVGLVAIGFIGSIIGVIYKNYSTSRRGPSTLAEEQALVDGSEPPRRGKSKTDLRSRIPTPRPDFDELNLKHAVICEGNVAQDVKPKSRKLPVKGGTKADANKAGRHVGPRKVNLARVPEGFDTIDEGGEH